MNLDIIIEYTDACCKAHPDILKRAWLTPTPAQDGVRGRVYGQYSETVTKGIRDGRIEDKEAVYTFRQFAQYGRHIDDGMAPPPNKIVLTCENGRVSVEKAWREPCLSENFERIPCVVTYWAEYPKQQVSAALSTNMPDATPTETPPAEPYVFRRDGNEGDFWQIVFEGRKLPSIRHLAGMTYIRAMLSKPGHSFSALDLYEIENPPPPHAIGRPCSEGAEIAKQHGTGGKPQKIIERLTARELEDAKAKLEEQFEETDCSEKQKDAINEKLEQIEDALLNWRVARVSGGATFEPKAAKQPRQAVGKAVDKAIDAIMEQNGNIAKHLSEAIRKGKSLAYVGALQWHT